MNAHPIGDKANSRKLIMSVAMLLVAVGIFGGFFYLQRQAGSADTAALAATAEEVFRDGAARRGMIYDRKNKMFSFPDLSPVQQETTVAKLKLIRAKWRPWAQRNKETLQKMLNAPANDEATLMAVYATLPSNPKERGISSRDLVPTNDLGAAFKARVPLLSWNPHGKGDIIPEKLRAQYEKSEQGFLKILKSDFAQLRDIRVSTSLTQPDPSFSLWASGRITQSKRVNRRWIEVRNGQKVRISSLEDGPHQEIVPPFEFFR